MVITSSNSCRIPSKYSQVPNFLIEWKSVMTVILIANGYKHCSIECVMKSKIVHAYIIYLSSLTEQTKSVWNIYFIPISYTKYIHQWIIKWDFTVLHNSRPQEAPAEPCLGDSCWKGNCPRASWCGSWTPLFVCTLIISILFIVYKLLLHVHLLYFIVHMYLTQLRWFTYYYLHYMYAVLFSSSPQTLSPQVWPLRYVTYFC